MPTIAISPCRKPLDYDAAVRRAGGTPRPLDVATDSPADVVRAVDGVLLTGGDDVDPALYGEAPHHTFGVAEPGRDAFEIELIQRALEADLPVLAICRGLQVLNVALGGTLVQDIPSEAGPHLQHDTEGPSTVLAHPIRVAPGSRLAGLVASPSGEPGPAVNSRHHQAIRVLGRGLVATAVAPDGVIEAVEAPGRSFCLAVQWHPENFHRTGEFDALFDGFIAACRTRPPSRCVRSSERGPGS